MPSATKTKRGRPKDATYLQKRREAILDAAAKVFAKSGYQNTEIQSVADACRVGKGTIYLYFPSKEELFLAAVDRGMRRLRDTVEAAIANVADSLETLSLGIHSYLQFFKDFPEYVELLIQERAEFRNRKKPTYFEHREANLERWRTRYLELITAGRIRNMPVDRILDVVCDLLYGTMFTNHFTGRHKPLEAQAADILDVLFNGLLTPAERRRREGEKS
jgi:AcrR family transcriptional regulator